MTATPLARQVPQKTMTADEVMRIRLRFNKALRAGMSNAEATAYANGSQVASGKIRRLIITVPPRNLKSLYASVALPACFLGHSPGQRVVVISYSELLARSHANDFRLLVIRSFQDLLGREAVGNLKAKNEWL